MKKQITPRDTERTFNHCNPLRSLPMNIDKGVPLIYVRDNGAAHGNSQIDNVSRYVLHDLISGFVAARYAQATPQNQADPTAPTNSNQGAHK
jgi:hypothetical protein